MDDFYFSLDRSDGSTLCLAPLTNRKIKLSDLEILDTSGYFLYEKEGHDEFSAIRIIAQVFSLESALLLRDTFKMS